MKGIRKAEGTKSNRSEVHNGILKHLTLGHWYKSYRCRSSHEAIRRISDSDWRKAVSTRR